MCKVLAGEKTEGAPAYKFVRCCMRMPYLGGVNIPWSLELEWRGKHINPEKIGFLLEADIRKKTQFSMSFRFPPDTRAETLTETINRLAVKSGTRPCLYPDATGVTFYWGAGKGCLSAAWLIRHAKTERMKPDPLPRQVFSGYELCSQGREIRG